MHLQAIKTPRELISRKLNRRTLPSEVFPLITVKLGAEALIREGGLLALLRQLPGWTGAPTLSRQRSRGACSACLVVPAWSGGAQPQAAGRAREGAAPGDLWAGCALCDRKLRPSSPKGNLPLLAKKCMSSERTALRALSSLGGLALQRTRGFGKSAGGRFSKWNLRLLSTFTSVDSSDAENTPSPHYFLFIEQRITVK